MDGGAFQIVSSSAVIRGELILMLMAMGIVVTVLSAAAIVQECGLRRSIQVLGWFGCFALALAVFGGIALVAIGLL